MNHLRLISFLFLLNSISPYHLLYGNEQTLKFFLTNESRDEKVIQYEIELWKEKSMQAEFPIKLLSKPGKVVLKVPSGYDYFRISAIAEKNIRGYWSDLYKVSEFGKPKPIVKFEGEISKPPIKESGINSDVLLPVPDQTGTLKPYLTSKKIIIKNESKLFDTIYTYRLNEGNWIESKTMEVEFQSDGFQVLEYGSTNILGNTEKKKRIEFFTDFTPPNTRYEITPNEFSTNNTIYTHPNAKLQLIAEDLGSGIKATYYQTECNGQNLSERKVIPETGLRFHDLKLDCGGSLKILFYSVDKVGNEESPKNLRIEFLRDSR